MGHPTLNVHRPAWVNTAGINTAGQLGDGTMMSSLAPIVVRGGLTFVDIAPGSSFSCGLLKNGSVACWVSALGPLWVALECVVPATYVQGGRG